MLQFLVFSITVMLTAAQDYSNPGSCSMAPAPYRAITLIKDSGTVSGTVKIDQAGAGQPTMYTGTISGLPANSQHGVHVHYFGDLSNGCTSGGDHFNPLNMTHGGLTDMVRHVGDLGNAVADANGVITISITDTVSQLVGSNSVIGRLFVLHQNMDDLGKGGNATSLANGNSGPRLACGIIGYRQNA
ncbi:superoxide dismutase [Cu-Zn]-like [Paramacrobiotus metropolitanus]|uniref:superoxide dismutase [Cu-Zn]-like n=1 Tax=Paramacrobiotus metropolitanus TaxID=2943436 RepID=UPI0024460DD8|nr:superoxide dismutase [Cu-Zn]-like [Paramacrobiotus metropolitanus]